ncbi:MAG: hypothetical protein ABIG43_01910 [Chloroflexota bacterium]
MVKLTLDYGLSYMQARAHNVGGDGEITAGPRDDTTTLARIPFSQEPVEPI